MVHFRNTFAHCLALAAVGIFCSTSLAAEPATAIDFNHDVRPILSDNCFHCHGPDPKDRQADLRLDVRTSVGKIHGAEAVFDPKNSAESELLNRITSDDPDLRMPPPDSGKVLTPAQIKTLRAWVAQGGKYQLHWA